MEKVTLLDGIFKQSQEKGKEYLLYLDVDRLVAPCYEAAGQTPKKPRYGGWEEKEIAGHSIGHWLMATSAMYAADKDEELKRKLDYAVSELAEIQAFDEDGYVSGFPRGCFDRVFSGEFQVDNFSLGGSWVPWYSIHKIYAGLIDAYTLTGNQNALLVVKKLADWAVNGLQRLTDEQFERMLICEYGGMNEAMADLYTLTGDSSYLELAKRFCHKALLSPLANGIDEMEGKHANTQIPKVIGAAKLYDITGEKQYRDIAEFFWNNVTAHRSYVIGGNSNGEHFGMPNSEELGVTTAETCNTYNMMKLTELLYSWEQKAEYFDFYERALYNHILASQDPVSGMKTYFVSTEPGHFKVYCSPDNSFWCCTGTGMENPARYNRSIYHCDERRLFVNLFISSRLEDPDHQLSLVQETAFPESNRTKLTFHEDAGGVIELLIRAPYWLSGEMKIKINGVWDETKSAKGYVSISRDWKKGDVIEIELPLNLHLYEAKDDPDKKAILYGPIVLAGALGREHFPESDIIADHLALNNHQLIPVPALVTDEKDVNSWVKRAGESLIFETGAIGQPGNVKLTLIPFYALHHQRYTLYWKVLTEEQYTNVRNEENDERTKLRQRTLDEVQPNEQQPEIEHEFKSANSRSGYLNTVHRGWRDCIGEGGFFSYRMKVQPEQENVLLVTYYGSDTAIYIDGVEHEREFDILIDGTAIAKQIVRSNKPGKLFDVVYEIPSSLTTGKQKVEVKFQSQIGKIAGGVYGIKTLKHYLAHK